MFSDRLSKSHSTAVRWRTATLCRRTRKLFFDYGMTTRFNSRPIPPVSECFSSIHVPQVPVTTILQCILVVTQCSGHLRRPHRTFSSVLHPPTFRTVNTVLVFP